MALTKYFLSSWGYSLIQNIQFNQKFDLNKLGYCLNFEKGISKIGVGERFK